jgi:hypothetical protein
MTTFTEITTIFRGAIMAMLYEVAWSSRKEASILILIKDQQNRTSLFLSLLNKKCYWNCLFIMAIVWTQVSADYKTKLSKY